MHLKFKHVLCMFKELAMYILISATSSYNFCNYKIPMGVWSYELWYFVKGMQCFVTHFTAWRGIEIFSFLDWKFSCCVSLPQSDI